MLSRTSLRSWASKVLLAAFVTVVAGYAATSHKLPPPTDRPAYTKSKLVRKWKNEFWTYEYGPEYRPGVLNDLNRPDCPKDESEAARFGDCSIRHRIDYTPDSFEQGRGDYNDPDVPHYVFCRERRTELEHTDCGDKPWRKPQ
jgi:hypothetical protein